jgi:hypothetical protein
MVRSLLERALLSTTRTVQSVLRHVADGETTTSLLRTVVNPALDKIKKDLQAKADEILEPHISGHPITYNRMLNPGSFIPIASVWMDIADLVGRLLDRQRAESAGRPKASADGEAVEDIPQHQHHPCRRCELPAQPECPAQ